MPTSLLDGAPVVWLADNAPAVDDGRRTVTGLVVPYGIAGHTSAGPLTVRRGAIRLPADLSRVKLLAGHDRDAPIGYALSATDGPDGLTMAFRVAPTPAGDAALVAAAHKVTDAFSVEVDDLDLVGDVIVDGELVAVALLAVPAFADARVASVAAQRREAPAMPTITLNAARTGRHGDRSNRRPDTDDAADVNPDPETADVDADVDDDLDDDTDDDTDTSTEPAPPAVKAARRPAGLPAGRSRRGPAMTFARTMEQLRRTVTDRGPAALVAALSDIVPGDDPAAGFLRPQWLDELWTPVAARRDFINSVAHQRLTSGLKVYGWKWKTLPVVGPYAGNKAAIPSNKAQTEPAEAPIERHAGGWDIDRIYVDLGEPGFLEAFFRAAAADLANKQEAGVAAVLIAEATPGDTGADPDLWEQVDLASRMLMQQGARMTFAGISSDLWAQYVSSTSVQVPWWVAANGANPSLTDATGDAAGIRFFCNADLDPGTVLAGDRQAVTFYEGPSVRVQAVNIPNGGVDLALFGYQATLVNDARGLVAVTATP